MIGGMNKEMMGKVLKTKIICETQKGWTNEYKKVETLILLKKEGFEKL